MKSKGDPLIKALGDPEMKTEGDQLIEALKNGEIDAVISRDHLFLLRLLEEEEALEQRVRDGSKEIARQAAQLRSLATELTLTEQRERSRIAEVLHDHLQQLLVAVHMEIAALRRKVLSPDAATHLTKISSMVDDCINATRLLSVNLAPPIQGPGGLAKGLEWLARWMQDKHGLKVDLRLDERAVCDQEQVNVLLFQSVRELLFNVVKHAQVSKAIVSLDLTPDAQLRIVVSDEGVGFDPSIPVSGLGLRRIIERLTLLGGQFIVESQPGLGSRFVLIASTTV